MGDQPMIRHRLDRVEVRELIFPNRCVAIAFIFADDAGELMFPFASVGQVRVIARALDEAADKIDETPDGTAN